jgi:hypothetical protein
MTPFTAFVAVDSEVTTGGDAQKVHVSVPLPEGLDYGSFSAPPLWGTARFNASSMVLSAAPMPPMARMQADTYVTGLSDLGDFADAEMDSAAPPQGILGGLFKRRARLGDRTEDMPDQQLRPPVLDFASTDERLKWLARTQNLNGSWDDDTEMTAAALLAFVRAAHTTRTGSYRQQVRKAANWLRAQITASGGFAVMAAVRALKELADSTGDFVLPDDMAQKLPAPTTDPERAAMNVTGLRSPAAVVTLDDLRLKALLDGDATVPDDLKQGSQDKLVQAWLAVGKPV